MWLVCLGEVNSYEMWSSGYEGTSKWEGVCRIYSGRWLPHAFHLLPSHTPVDEQECLLKHTHARTLILNTSPLTLSLLYALYKGLHTCTHKHKLFPSHYNMNRHVHTASHLDVTALPGLLCYIKNSTPIIVKLQADGDESAWFSLRSCESCFLLSQFIWEIITSYSSHCTERISLIYSTTHLCVFAIFTASHHISSLSQGWYFCVNMCSQTHYK